MTTAIDVTLRSTYLKAPNHQETMDIVRGFRDRWSFPQCAGTIDGSHIPIIAPSENRNDYYNRKGWYSVILQAVCDHRYRIWDIDVGWPGKVHDARVFANSAIYRAGEAGVLFPDRPKRYGNVNLPISIIGDPAYPLMPWVMKAYPEGPGTAQNQRIFNYRLSRARMCIENTFGRLKGRWRLLRKQMEHDISTIPTIVSACCILHNICEVHREAYNVGPDDAQPRRRWKRGCSAERSSQKHSSRDT